MKPIEYARDNASRTKTDVSSTAADSIYMGRVQRGTTPFGNLAIRSQSGSGPMALRPILTDGLPLSWFHVAVLDGDADFPFLRVGVLIYVGIDAVIGRGASLPTFKSKPRSRFFVVKSRMTFFLHIPFDRCYSSIAVSAPTRSVSEAVLQRLPR